MAKYLSKRDPFKFNSNPDVIHNVKNLSLEEAVVWLRSGEVSIDSTFNDDQVGALSYITQIDFTRVEAMMSGWMYPGDECLTVKLKNYSRKDKPPFSRTSVKFVLVSFSNQE